ncbi:MAG: hypothetical protein IJ246_10570 [Clostridia bacterium]|nr:hypothetical protein [Clostridia bacterium]
MKQVALYTGAICEKSDNPVGAWSCILTFGGHEKRFQGYQPGTTLERMEIFSIITGLGALKEPCEVHVHSASKALLKMLRTKPLSAWMMDGWKDADGKEVPCRDLYMILFFQSKKHHLAFVPWNPEKLPEEGLQCMQMARESILAFQKLNTPMTEEEFLMQHPDLLQENAENPES